jgi:dTDP-4-dehydrorhamnose 3,5-epimerase
MSDNVTVEYLMDERYTAELADGFRYDDPASKIDWPLPARFVSDRDLAWPPLSTRPFWQTSEGGSITHNETYAAT